MTILYRAGANWIRLNSDAEWGNEGGDLDATTKPVELHVLPYSIKVRSSVVRQRAIQARIVTHSNLGKVSGKPTKKPPIRKPLVLGQAVKWRQVNRAKVHTLAFFIEAHGAPQRIGLPARKAKAPLVKTSVTWIRPVSGGIRFDAQSNASYQSANSSYSWNHTCTGLNRELFVGVSILTNGATVSVQSITYNSVNLRKIGVRTQGAIRAELWVLTAPTLGTNSIAVTLTGGTADSVGGAVSLTGVHQTFDVESENDNSAVNGGAADATVNVITVANNDWVINVVATDDTAITAVQIQRTNVSGAAGSGAMETIGPKPVSTVTTNWTNVDAGKTWSIVATGVRPLAAPGKAKGGRILVVLQAVSRASARSATRRWVHSFIAKPKGHATNRPPIRQPLVMDTQSVVRRLLLPRLKTKAQFTATHGHITRRPPIRPLMTVLEAVKQRWVLRQRMRTQAQLGKPKGHKTVNPPIRRPLALLQAVKWRQVNRGRIPTKAILGKPKGHRTNRPPIRPLLVWLQTYDQRRLNDAHYRTHAQLGKPKGHKTVNPPIRRPLVLSQANKWRQVNRNRIHTVALFIRPHGAVIRPRPPRVVRFQAVEWRQVNRPKLHTLAFFLKHYGHATNRPPVRKPLVVLQTKQQRVLNNPRYRTKAILGKPKGHATNRPPIRKPIVLSQAVQWRQVNRPKLHTLAFFGHKPFKQPVVAAHIKSLEVLGQAVQWRQVNRPKFKTTIFLGKPKGHATNRPPIRRLMVVAQAVERSRPSVRRIKTRAVLGRPRGHITRNPPIRRPLVVGQAINRALRQRRQYVHTRLGAVRRTFAPIVRRPRPILAVLQAVAQNMQRRRIRTKVAFIVPSSKPVSQVGARSFATIIG
jgi:hypothetical protein